MNPFTTGYYFLRGYGAAKLFTSYIPDFEELREAGDLEGERDMIRVAQKAFVEALSQRLKITYEVTGAENIPDGPFMIYSNHQGFADIPALCWLMKDRDQIGFVAKEEWRKYRILRQVVEYTRSIFLVRNNPKEAVRAVADAKKILGMGFNLAIFPEGTRSKGREPGEFKPGAFKFAEKAKVPIVPVTLDGSYKLFEEKGSYQPCHIKITVHPPVHIENMDKHEQKEAAEQITATIIGAL